MVILSLLLMLKKYLSDWNKEKEEIFSKSDPMNEFQDWDYGSDVDNHRVDSLDRMRWRENVPDIVKKWLFYLTDKIEFKEGKGFAQF